MSVCTVTENIGTSQRVNQLNPLWAPFSQNNVLELHHLTLLLVLLFWAAGPFLISRFRPDLERKFGDDFMKYVYHCNAQNPR